MQLTAYSFPTPHKWRKYTKCNNTSNSERVLILLGGDNFSCFPLNIEEDKRGVTLLKSRLSDGHIIYGPVNPSSIPWLQSKNNINMVNVMSVSVVDIQEQLLLTISADKYLDPSNKLKLSQTRRSCPSLVKTSTEPQKEHQNFTSRPSQTRFCFRNGSIHL